VLKAIEMSPIKKDQIRWIFIRLLIGWAGEVKHHRNLRWRCADASAAGADTSAEHPGPTQSRKRVWAHSAVVGSQRQSIIKQCGPNFQLQLYFHLLWRHSDNFPTLKFLIFVSGIHICLQLCIGSSACKVFLSTCMPWIRELLCLWQTILCTCLCLENICLLTLLVQICRAAH
jgi:hypothetical protein